MPCSEEFKDAETGTVHTLPWMEARMAWDQDHPVRHRMWRAYVNGSQPLQLVRRHVMRPARQFWQRGRRGWCDEDSFAIDEWLSRLMPGMLDEIRRREIGWPGEPMTFEEWAGDGGILDQIAKGFRAAKLLMDYEYGNEGQPSLEELQAQFEQGFDLFKQWFFALWD